MKFNAFFFAVLSTFLVLGCSGNQSSGSQNQSTTAAQPAPAPTPAPAPAPAPAPGFSKTLSLQGVTYVINDEGGQVRVQPTGIERNEPVVVPIDGRVVNAEIEDLNSDGAPEVMIYTSAGANNYGKAFGFSPLGKRSIIQITAPEIINDPALNQGYDGHDEFAIVETTLVRRFPIYANGQRTGKTRQIQYKLREGEATRVFVQDKVMEY